MGRSKAMILSGKWVSAAIVLIGIIHVAATFTPFISDNTLSLSRDSADVFICFSLCSGISLMLCGVLLLWLLKHCTQSRQLITPLQIIGVFMLLVGVLSVYYMTDNPFAWTIAVLGLAILAILLKIRADFKRPPPVE